MGLLLFCFVFPLILSSRHLIDICTFKEIIYTCGVDCSSVQYLKGATGELGKDYLSGSAVIGEGVMVFN